MCGKWETFHSAPTHSSKDICLYDAKETTLWFLNFATKVAY